MRLTFALAALMLATFQAGSTQPPLSLMGAIELPRVEGRIDHLAVDLAAQRLYVAALGNNTVEVLDVKRNSHVKSPIRCARRTPHRSHEGGRRE